MKHELLSAPADQRDPCAAIGAIWNK